MKFLSAILLLCVFATAISCGGGSKSSTAGMPLSGNWQITLVRHNLAQEFPYSGFLQQSGNAITGSVILNSTNGCAGVGPVTGTLNGQNLQLDINEFGQDITLTGTVPSLGGSDVTSMSGQFSNVSGGCLFSSTGNWSAVRVTPLTGSFHGAFQTQHNGTLDVTGTMTQGSNIGASNASISGSITASGNARFCSYLTTATITGVISGTSVLLTLYGPDGSQIGQIGQAGSSPAVPATITADATSLSGPSLFLALDPVNCPQDEGTVQLTFP